jgi:signal transduction histidine kinase
MGPPPSSVGRTPEGAEASYVVPVTKRARRLFAAHTLDVMVAVVAVLSVIVVFGRDDVERTSQLAHAVEAAGIGVAILLLLLRRAQPFLAPAGLWLCSTALSFYDGRLVVSEAGIFLAGLVAAVLLGNLSDVRQARAGLAIVVVGAVTIVYNNPLRDVAEFVFIPLLFATGWLIGYAFRERAEQVEAAERRAAQAERERQLTARVAVAEERARIARELHDVVAHSVSVMVLHVGAVRHRLPVELQQDKEALRNVEDAGRTALAEMRTLLGALRNEEDEVALSPSPTLAALDHLVGDVTDTGLRVETRIEGLPLELPHALELSAYRIVQEGLTNALKHAQASSAIVTVRYQPDELMLEVRDDGRGTSASDGLGHGLVGIEERVKIFGGQMSAETVEDGGFALRASLPLVRSP